MVDLLSILLGLFFAWVIIMVVDRVTSGYEPAPMAPSAPTYVCKPAQSESQDALLAVGLATRMDLPADSIVKNPDINMPRPNLDQAPMPGAPQPEPPMSPPDSAPLMTSSSSAAPPPTGPAPAPVGAPVAPAAPTTVPPASPPSGAVLQQAPSPTPAP